MRTKIIAVVIGCLLALGFAASASADEPAPGLLGYEGQPGNQGGQTGGGLLGYEGQPGNQGG